MTLFPTFSVWIFVITQDCSNLISSRKSSLFLSPLGLVLTLTIPILQPIITIWGLSWWLSGKESTSRRCRFDPWVKKIPWRRKWQPTPVFLPGKSQRQRSLVGCSPWGCRRVRFDLATRQQQICIVIYFVFFFFFFQLLFPKFYQRSVLLNLNHFDSYHRF